MHTCTIVSLNDVYLYMVKQTECWSGAPQPDRPLGSTQGAKFAPSVHKYIHITYVDSYKHTAHGSAKRAADVVFICTYIHIYTHTWLSDLHPDIHTICMHTYICRQGCRVVGIHISG